VQAVVPQGANGQVQRVADRFSLVAAVGEIATALELTDWPAGTARDAAAAKRRISEALQLHGSSRFQRWVKNSSDRMVIVNRLGFVKTEGNADVEEVESTYYFMNAPLKELLAGMDFRTVIAELMALGVIVSQNGKPNKVFHVSSGGGKQRLYQIDATKLDDAAGSDDAQSG